MGIKSLALPGLVAIVVGAAALALGHSRSAPAATSAVVRGTSAHLAIVNYTFTPAALTVKLGTQVTVTNRDQTAHTATAMSGAFDSGTLKPGQSVRITLSKLGTYTYICQFHAFMNGTIKVVQ